MPNPSASSAPSAGQTAPDYDFTEQVGHLLRRAYQRHVAIFQQTIPDSQLTAAQFVVLCAVRDRQPCSLNEVVRATAIDQATVRGIIERLKARKLIAVSHDPNDRRKVVVTVTPGGLALIDETVPFAKQISEQTFGGLNPAERVAVTYLLRKMSEIDEGNGGV
ncbi:MarR family winged helix-turn-helix transcriptional regulator [Cupriavidus oxalaticus]|uniref:MarR family transcriptional regulator n=1 Tax=Cupriavidus oxalaticus TaxID=96344 RepID=A0A5P3VQA8_9BURK|nr:MarR family winged helix-turn-helix transcriptional regulator [Cupriavidus oxalaticus]QEZ48410.1 MarR family transcriptional regulator [Cupriavidus oxalaticus]QRQ86632.1 winged helix-turn-helix transcriptional regulator [Cupriavidus oxalaticus]QRQ95040.1 winged helix-turn-helix transcriptional regulator [Cupriavidus oxalaticus]WQD83696.1 MarR family winged helix-turn-helix transcriptional regulator [Cupriavidus oxalaticus]